jgi:hypothetical protein
MQSLIVLKWLEAIEPGANPPIEAFPILWYLPGNWKKRAFDVRDLMDKTWSKARAIVDDRRKAGDFRDSLIDNKIDDYTKSGFPMSQHAFNNLFGELLEAGADSKFEQPSQMSEPDVIDSNGEHDFDTHPGICKVSRGSKESAERA